MFKICIDAGHGGKDPGAIGLTGLKEKDVTLAIGMELKSELSRHGVTITMTRDTDREVNPLAKNQTEELQARCDIANKAKADYFISIHCNSFTDPASHGSETWITAAGGKAEQLAKVVHPEVVAAQGAADRKIHVKGFYVLRKTNMPAILVENLFISNPAEEKKLRDPVFQKMTAQAIAKGVMRFMGNDYKPSNAPTNPAVTVAGIDKLQAQVVQLQNENQQLKGDNQKVIAQNNALKAKLSQINSLSKQEV